MSAPVAYELEHEPRAATSQSPGASRTSRWSAVFALALTVLGGAVVPVGGLLVAWGLLGTAAAVAWWTWLSRVLPDDAEAGGGLMVAVIQLAIALGSTLGGALYDASGHRSTFVFAEAALCASALVASAIRRASLHPQRGENLP